MSQPTPILSHLGVSDYRDVYEPAEDSFLLMDALEKDTNFLNQMRPLICVEVGSGSGAILAFLEKLLHAPSFCFALDINAAACRCTKETLSLNCVSSYTDVVVMDLVASLKRKLRRKVDVIIFNPPYVVTPSEEVGSRGIQASWAGGINGREVIDQFLPCVPELMAPGGVFYLVVTRDNKPGDICSIMASYQLENETILSRKAKNEYLSVIKFCK